MLKTTTGMGQNNYIEKKHMIVGTRAAADK